MCTYAVPLYSYFYVHHPLCHRHCHQGDTPFSALYLHCLSSGGPTWSELSYRVLPTNQVIIHSVPPWKHRHQWRSTNSHQLQYSPEVLTHSDPLATPITVRQMLGLPQISSLPLLQGPSVPRGTTARSALAEQCTPEDIALQ